MVINNRVIDNSRPPYFVAEISANHGGKLENAIEAIMAAKNAGADAVKIQTYEPRTLTIDCDKEDFVIKNGLWKGKILYQLYKEAHTPYSWHKDIFEFAASENITLFSAPFDEEGVELLEKLGSPAYKIASFELVDTELIKAAAQTKKPLIMSTGMASENEIEAAIETARINGAKDIALLHCASEYPAPPESANIKSVPYMKKRFNLTIGLSDHTLTNSAAIASVALGAAIIEKHFIHDNKLDSPDKEFSISPQEFLALKNEAVAVWKTLGGEGIFRSKSEKKSLIFRRSLYVIKDIKSGEKFTRENLRSIRPGFGLSPSYINNVLGEKAAIDISRGTALKQEMIAR